MITAKQRIYRRQPAGQITTDHYELIEQALDTTLADGEALIAARYFRIQGMLACDYLHRMDEMIRIVGLWVKAGEIVFEETVTDGFEQLPSALNSLFTGDHRGKLLVRA